MRSSTFLVLLGLLTALYFVAGKFGLALAFVNPSATAVWPPTGLALWAVLVLGPRAWPAIMLGAFLVNVTTAGSISTSAAIAVGNTLEACVGGLLVRRFAHGPDCFDRPADVIKFGLLAAGMAPTISATIGVTSLALAGFASWDAYLPVWLTWWAGDAAAALLLTPFLTLWSVGPARRWSRGKIVEGVLMLGTVMLFGLSVFAGAHPWPLKSLPIGFLVAPALVWAALRFGPRATATASVLIAGIAIWGTLHGVGPFVRENPNEALVLLQAFLGTLSITALALAASVVERNRAAAVARDAEERLALVAERERAEQALATAQAIAHLGSWEWDVRGDVITWSDELYRIYGLDPNTFAATYEGFLSRVHPDDVARVDAIVQAAYHDHRPFDFFHRVVRPGGDERVIHARGEVVVGQDGKPLRMMGTGHDVTALKQAEAEHTELMREQAARAQAEAVLRERDEFLAVAAHELKTPITSLRLYAEHLARQLAEGRPVPGDQLADRVDKMVEQSDKLARLVNQLLVVSQIEAGQLQLAREPADLSKIVVQAVERAQLQASDHHIQLETPPSAPAVVDGVRLEQAVTNLLDNAIKYSPAASPIEVSVQREAKNTYAIAVRDHGSGVDLEHRPYIFDRFYQGEVQQHSPGLGLGLFVSRQIIELHAGQLIAEFPPDGGSRLVIRIPSGLDESAGGL